MLHRKRQFLRNTPPPPPMLPSLSAPLVQGWVPKEEIIHCCVCQRQGGGLSMGPAMPGPAPTASQALLFRCTQQGLQLWTRGQFSPGKVSCVVWTVGSGVLMRWKGCQWGRGGKCCPHPDKTHFNLQKWKVMGKHLHQGCVTLLSHNNDCSAQCHKHKTKCFVWLICSKFK